MKFWVGVTDNDWFEFLARLKPDEVNFWQPGGNVRFQAIERSSPFLFKLHSPKNYIVGGGFFQTHSFLPLSIAWETFEAKNGAPDFVTMRKRILKYRGDDADRPEIDPQIGCIILTSPFFFSEKDYIHIPSDWSANIVSGKTYDTQEHVGEHLWRQVEERLQALEHTEYGPVYLARTRLGQGAFRITITEVYNRRCAITGERTLPVLQAAHIKPVSEKGSHEISNGLLLRADLHILFDEGYLTITDKFDVEVSKRIREEFENGRDYYALHGKKLKIIPKNEADRPSIELLKWHNKKIFAA